VPEMRGLSGAERHPVPHLGLNRTQNGASSRRWLRDDHAQLFALD
jgi:hypothetical protein